MSGFLTRQTKYFNTIDAWRIEKVVQGNHTHRQIVIVSQPAWKQVHHRFLQAIRLMTICRLVFKLSLRGGTAKQSFC